MIPAWIIALIAVSIVSVVMGWVWNHFRHGVNAAVAKSRSQNLTPVPTERRVKLYDR